jgi:hypothetical protein
LQEALAVVQPTVVVEVQVDFVQLLLQQVAVVH